MAILPSMVSRTSAGPKSTGSAGAAGIAGVWHEQGPGPLEPKETETKKFKCLSWEVGRVVDGVPADLYTSGREAKAKGLQGGRSQGLQTPARY